MIWLKEDDNVVSYIPGLNKIYDDIEIRKMADASPYFGWSNLSQLVMEIQGVGYDYYGGFNDHYTVKAIPLIEVNCSFHFEYQLINDPYYRRKDEYIALVKDVLDHLTLYKVKEHSINNMQESVKRLKDELSFALREDTITNVDRDVSNLIGLATSTSENLKELDATIGLRKDFLQVATEEQVQQSLVKRNTNKMLHKEDLPL